MNGKVDDWFDQDGGLVSHRASLGSSISGRPDSKETLSQHVKRNASKVCKTKISRLSTQFWTSNPYGVKIEEIKMFSFLQTKETLLVSTPLNG